MKPCELCCSGIQRCIPYVLLLGTFHWSEDEFH